MSDFLEFKNRIYSFEPNSFSDDLKKIEVNVNLKDKVTSDGEFKQFYGDTVVFELTESEKAILTNYQDMLYDNCGECFAERLPKSTFHMTLHDLNNSVNYTNIQKEMEESKAKVSKIFKELIDTQGNTTIKLKSSYAFNMVNTSIVLGLEPVNEEEYDKLMLLYNKFEQVKKLGYPLTPHITLAYYRHKNIELDSINKLKEVIKEINSSEMVIDLKLENLCYQYFTNMKDYDSVFYGRSKGNDK